MQVAVYDAVLAGTHIRGYMASTAGPLLERDIEVSGIRVPVRPEHWRYQGLIVMRQSDGMIVERIRRSIKKNGYCVARMPDPSDIFHVTDIEFDESTWRTYSTSRNIDIIRRYFDAMALGRNGQPYENRSESYVGEVKIPNAAVAQAMGIDDYVGLVVRGIHVSLHRVEDVKRVLEKKILRELKKLETTHGIHVEGVEVHSITALGDSEESAPQLPPNNDEGDRVMSATSYHSIFLSHTSADKPIARRIFKDLMRAGASEVWIDEAEIKIGDSLINKIQDGLERAQYVGVILSPRSVKSKWVLRELEVALNKEINESKVVVLPLLFEDCEIPAFISGKLYADFRDPTQYRKSFSNLLDRLRV